ncbi:hypothetical protein HETIRDRAFT_429794 [Heterobasidion irregulare TC 32-1]|uniref:Uncharacterized protein n=1 Tax=Heterobasidion irregulare (strain TC 32-1) TaxID=747525 RepID=W4JRV8_HETIT|nr:uncharacterized protein HETIRDRAFT_429794 [Heterobasidion irregulare TC 32-1]ETW76282.1 hypothetical protein HETIRDRAFT_429794 [Heterobasidion irregulare TC 32-1]
MYSIRSLKLQSRGVTHILFGFEALSLRITIDAPRPAWVDALYENMHAIQKAYETEMQREFRPIKASYNDLKRKCGKPASKARVLSKSFSSMDGERPWDDEVWALYRGCAAVEDAASTERESERTRSIPSCLQKRLSDRQKLTNQHADARQDEGVKSRRAMRRTCVEAGGGDLLRTAVKKRTPVVPGREPSGVNTRDLLKCRNTTPDERYHSVTFITRAQIEREPEQERRQLVDHAQYFRSRDLHERDRIQDGGRNRPQQKAKGSGQRENGCSLCIREDICLVAVIVIVDEDAGDDATASSWPQVNNALLT